MDRLDALQDCAEHPTNVLTKKAYADNPQEKNRIIDSIDEARFELKSNTAARFLGHMLVIGSGLVPASD